MFQIFYFLFSVKNNEFPNYFQLLSVLYSSSKFCCSFLWSFSFFLFCFFSWIFLDFLFFFVSNFLFFIFHFFWNVWEVGRKKCFVVRVFHKRSKIKNSQIISNLLSVLGFTHPQNFFVDPFWQVDFNSSAEVHTAVPAIFCTIKILFFFEKIDLIYCVGFERSNFQKKYQLGKPFH